MQHVNLTRTLPPATRHRKAVSVLMFKVGFMLRGLIPLHQRCDGKRPCATCVNGERGAECTYEPRRRSLRASASAPPAPRETASHPLPSKPLTTGFTSSEPLTHPLLGTPLLTLSNSSEPASSLPPPLALYEGPQAPSSDVSIVRHTYNTEGCAPRPTVSFTVLPSIHFRAIHRPLHVPLSLIPPERVQISPIAGGDLDMTLCVLSISGFSPGRGN